MPKGIDKFGVSAPFPTTNQHHHPTDHRYGFIEEPALSGIRHAVYPTVAYTLRVVYITGQVLIDKAGQTNTGLNRLTVALPASAGMLILVMKVGDATLTRRLIRP